jgi:hypothetical protein
VDSRTCRSLGLRRGQGGKRLKNRQVLLGLLLIGSAEIALAQTTASRPPSFGAQPRPTQTVSRTIGIRAAVDASYDSNAFGLNDALIARGSLGQRSKDDITITPSLQLDIALPFGRQSAYLRGVIGYDFFLNNPQLERERIQLDGGVNVQVGSGCSGLVNGAYGRFRSNPGDIFAVDGEPLIRSVNTQETRSFGVRGQCGGAIGLTPSVGYQHSENRNSSPFFQLNDSNSDSFDASLGYSRPSLGRISIYGTYTTAEYLNRNVLGLPFDIPNVPNDGVKSYSAGLRFERSIGTRIAGTVAAGYTWVDPKNLFSSRFRGSSYSASLNVRPYDRMSIDVLASRSAEVSNTVFASYSLTEVYSLNGTLRLNGQTSVNFGSSYQTRDYRGRFATVDQAVLLSEDEFIRAYVGVAYDLNRRIRLNGLFSQQRRKADNPLFNFNNTTVSLGVSLALGRR